MSAAATSAQKVIVVMPAYNAEQTLEQTLRDLPAGSYDEVLVGDDCSKDNTVEVARKLGLDVLVTPQNLGYGGNQKMLYREALARGADIVVMLHPDYQYDPKLVPHYV
ncbi:MAG: glycosyltransferase family 2 protein, partial [Planctomycetota bacterium]|nr:glycosyltransferase family 2 protein [Planctomycetota bacterium]